MSADSHSSAHQRLSRWFSCRIAQRMAAYCSFFRSPTAFMMDCTPYCSADGIGLLNHPLANCFDDDLRAADYSPYRSFFRSSTSIIPGRFAYSIPQLMAADYSFSHSSKAFTTVCAPYCSADGVADCSFFLSSTAFTMIYAPYCSADGRGLLIPSLINGFHNSLRAVLLCGWQRIAQSSARQQLSRRFARRIA